MRFLKKASALLSLLVLLFSFSQTHAQAVKCYPVTLDNYREIAKEVISDFSTTHTLISETEIENIFLTELSGFINPFLFPPDPHITGHIAPSVSFRWDTVPGPSRPYFVSNAYNLEILNEKVTGGVSPMPGVNYILPAQEYDDIWMYSFYTAQQGERSTLHVVVVDIIIIDKDATFTCEEYFRKRLAAAPGPGVHISPNPFQDFANIKFELPEEGITAIEVYNLTGQLVTQALAPQKLTKGIHRMEFDWSHLPAGTYTCLLRSPQRVYSQLMIKAKD